jgi:hypothetical protein
MIQIKMKMKEKTITRMMLIITKALYLFKILQPRLQEMGPEKMLEKEEGNDLDFEYE